MKVTDEIRKQYIRKEYNRESFKPSFYNTVKEICEKKPMLSPSAKVTDAYELMNDPKVTEVAIIDDNGKFLGVLTERQVVSALSGMYGYNLHFRKNVGDFMDTSCLIVREDTPIEAAAKMAMARCQPYVYDAIPVINGSSQEYRGFVGIKSPFAIIYFDLDNFKAYNDAYGFTNGDLMIKTVADALTKFCCADDFCGHIGGDDFVVITNGDRTESLCHDVFCEFSNKSRYLYCEEDRNRGYIVSKNRSGFIEEFPLATLSVAAITNRELSFESINELSIVIAQTKKLAKQRQGNSLVIV